MNFCTYSILTSQKRYGVVWVPYKDIVVCQGFRLLREIKQTDQRQCYIFTRLYASYSVHRRESSCHLQRVPLQMSGKRVFH